VMSESFPYPADKQPHAHMRGRVVRAILTSQIPRPNYHIEGGINLNIM
jgi:hypothetical protein